ncbi:extracellular solute-binding protein [Micrococcales bacterium 31B]|nr:extracellular solute-binding protein [Micrococcales bacterium 31B]
MPLSPQASAVTRRTALGVLGVGALAGIGASWPRLTARDIPGRGSDALQVCILGTAQDAAARAGLVKAFTEQHPDIPVNVIAIQGADWSNFFAKILTLVAAGTSPDVVVVATEGAQLFAERLAEPLDEYVKRDAAAMQDYFDDVHPSLIEAFCYNGSLYQLPLDFNAPNLYYNVSALNKAGLDRPADDWTKDDFTAMLRQLKQTGGSNFVPYYWNNRLWGGVVPWLYAHDTSFLTERKATGGDWLWENFYPDQPARSGGYLWTEASANTAPVQETFEYLQMLVADGLATSPAQGGGGELIGQFSSGSIGFTPAGGFWVQGLHEAGMSGDDYDVQFFPRWTSQRHQFGAAGYAMMKTSTRKQQAWEWIKFCATKEAMQLAMPTPTTTPTRRSMVNEAFYAGTGPRHWQVFYDTLEKFPTTAPMPAPPQQAAVESALIKNVTGAVTGSKDAVKLQLETMQRDLTLALERG